MRIYHMLTVMVMLTIVTLLLAISPNAFASTVPNPTRAVVHEVYTGRAFPTGIIGYRIRVDLYHYPSQQNFSGIFTEQNRAVSVVTGSKGEAEFAPGTYYIQFTIENIRSGRACLYCQYTGTFANSALLQAKGYWQSPTGKKLGDFYLNKVA
jgi:hypothetical protein